MGKGTVKFGRGEKGECMSNMTSSLSDQGQNRERAYDCSNRAEVYGEV